MTLQQNRCRPITNLFEVGFWNYLTEMTTMLRQRVMRNIWVATLKVKVTAWPCSISVWPITLLFEVGLWNYFTEMITILRRRVTRNIWVATLKVKVTAWPCSKIVSGLNFVIWGPILKLLHRNDHRIKTTCHAQHFGRCLEGQGHSVTLQQNHVWPITLLFEIGFYNYFTEMITIFEWHISGNILVATLKVKVTTFWQKWSPYWDALSLPCPFFGSMTTILHSTK